MQRADADPTLPNRRQEGNHIIGRTQSALSGSCDRIRRASVSNTVGGQPPMLERAVFAGGISPEECERIHRLARQRWKEFHREMTKEMRSACATAQPEDSARIRIGVYAYFEDQKAELDFSTPTSTGRQRRKE